MDTLSLPILTLINRNNQNGLRQSTINLQQLLMVLAKFFHFYIFFPKKSEPNRRDPIYSQSFNFSPAMQINETISSQNFIYRRTQHIQTNKYLENMQGLLRQQSHCIRKYVIQLTIEKIHLRVRFPCEVTAALRIGKEETQCRLQMPLRDGKVVLQDRVDVSVGMAYNRVTRQYSPRKGEILVYLVTDGKMNIAGTCSVDVCEVIKNPSSRILVSQLIQCPDSSAKIEFRVKAVFIAEIEATEGSECVDSPRKSDLSIIMNNRSPNSPNNIASMSRHRASNPNPLLYQLPDLLQQSFHTPNANRNVPNDQSNSQALYPHSYAKSQLNSPRRQKLIDITANKRNCEKVIHNQNTQRLQILKRKIMESREEIDRNSKQSTPHYSKTKDVFYKAEMKRIAGELAEMVSQRNQLVSELQALRCVLQESQHKTERNSKENQRLINEERIRAERKLMEMQEQVQHINDVLREQNDELHEKIQQANVRVDHFQRQLVEKQQQKMRFLQQCESSKTQLIKQKLQRASLQEELHRLALMTTSLNQQLLRKNQHDLKSHNSSPKHGGSNFSNLGREIEKYALEMKEFAKRDSQMQKIVESIKGKLMEEVDKTNKLEREKKERQKEIVQLTQKCAEIQRQCSKQFEGKYKEAVLELQQTKKLLDDKDKAISAMSRDYEQRIQMLQNELQAVLALLLTERKSEQERRSKQYQLQTTRRQELSNQFQTKLKHVQSTNKERMDFLQLKNNKLEKLKDQLQIKILKFEGENDIKSLTLLENKTTIEGFKERQTQLQGQLQLKEQLTKKLKEECDQMSEKVRKAETKQVEKELQKEGLSHQLEILQKQHLQNENQIKLLKSRNEQLNETNKQLSKKLAITTAETERLKHKEQFLSDQLFKTSQDGQQNKTKSEELQQYNSQLQYKLQIALAQLQTKSEHIDQQTSKKFTANSELKTVKEQLRAITTERSALKEQLRAAQMQSLTLKELLVSRDQQLTCLQRQLECRAANLNELDQLRQQSTQHSHELSKLSLLEATVSNLQYQLADHASIHQLLATRQRKLAISEKNLAESSQLIIKFSAKVKDLVGQYEGVQKDVKRKSEELQRFMKEEKDREDVLVLKIEGLMEEKRLFQEKYEIERWERQGVQMKQTDLEQELAKVTQQFRRYRLSSEESEGRLLQIVNNLQIKSPKTTPPTPTFPVLITFGRHLTIHPTTEISILPQILKPSLLSSPQNQQIVELTKQYNSMKKEYQDRIEILQDELNTVMVENDLLNDRQLKTSNSFQQHLKQFVISPIKQSVGNSHHFNSQRLSTVQQQTFNESLNTIINNKQYSFEHVQSQTRLNELQSQLSKAYRQSRLRQSQLKTEIQRLTSINRQMIQKVQVLYSLIMKNKSTAVTNSPSKIQTTTVLNEFKDMQGKAIQIMEYSRQVMYQK